MDFSNWYNDSEPLDEFYKHFVAGVDIKLVDGKVAVSFPKERSQRMVASTEYSGDLISEYSFTHAKGGKGGAATDFAPAPFKASFKNNQDIDKFNTTFSNIISNIAIYLGLLFEIEIYLYLVKNKKLAYTTDLVSVKTKKEEYSNFIKAKTSKYHDKIMLFVELHAKTIGDMIFSKSETLLKGCNVDTVTFIGGSSSKADIILSCSSYEAGDRSSLGFSAKFIGENRIRISTPSLPSMYKMFGGRDRNFLPTAVGLSGEKKKRFVLGELYHLGKSLGKQEWNGIVNYLVFGSNREDVLMAIGYYPHGRHMVGIPSKLKEDFIVSEKEGRKLKIREDAEIEVGKVDKYFYLRVKGPESRDGTAFRFMLDDKENKIIVEMTKLTTK